MLAATLLLCSAPATQLVIVSRVVAPEDARAAVASPDVELAVANAAGWFLDVTVVPRSQGRSDLVEDIRRCAADARCTAARLGQRGVDQALVTTTNLRVTPSVTTVELFDEERAAVVANDVVSATPDEPLAGLEPAVRGLLSNAGHRLGAKLSVSTSPAGAVAHVSPAGAMVAGSIVLPPGSYEVVVELEGYESVARSVTLTAGAAESIDMQLETSPSILASPLLWVGAAVVVAGVVTAVLLANRGDTLLCHPGPCPE
jgi:hypothetical protein